MSLLILLYNHHYESKLSLYERPRRILNFHQMSWEVNAVFLELSLAHGYCSLSNCFATPRANPRVRYTFWPNRRLDVYQG